MHALTRTGGRYRYQLEAFVDKVRERTPQYWTDPKTTITQLEAVGRIYAAVSPFRDIQA